MGNFNKVILLGNLTRDPEMKYSQNGHAICRIGMAVNRKTPAVNGNPGKEETCFVDVTAFGKKAELIAQHYRKGQSLFMEGRLNFSQWEDRQSGQKRSKLDVVLESFEFTDGGSQGQGGPQQRQPQPQAQGYGQPSYGQQNGGQSYAPPQPAPQAPPQRGGYAPAQGGGEPDYGNPPF